MNIILDGYHINRQYLILEELDSWVLKPCSVLYCIANANVLGSLCGDNVGPASNMFLITERKVCTEGYFARGLCTDRGASPRSVQRQRTKYPPY